MHFPCVRVLLFTVLLALLPLRPAAAEKPGERPSAAERSGAAEAENRTGKTNSNVADTLFWAPEIIVNAHRVTPQADLFNRSGFVALIDVERHRDRMEDVPMVLSRSVGVRVKQYGGLGSFATVSIRGSSSNQVQIYMDGVPLNDAYTGIADISDLALGNLKRIEVFRGFSPTAYGSSSIGGTINLVTRGAESIDGSTAVPAIEALASAGSFSTRRYMLTLASRMSLARLHGHISHVQSDGSFTFYDDNATGENPLDDETAARVNSDFSRWNFTGRLGLAVPGFNTASLNYDVITREGGVPGLGSNQSSTARSERERRLLYAKLEPLPILSRRLHLDATGYYSWTAERFDDPAGDIGLTKQKIDNRITFYGGNMRSKLFVPVIPLSLDLFFEGRKDRFHPVSHLPSTTVGPDRLRETQTLAISGDLWLLGERLVFTAGARHQWHENEFYDEPHLPWLPPTPQGTVSRHTQTPSFGFRVNPASFLTIKGNWGRYYRLPTFFELFGNIGSVTGEAGLENEKGLNRDVGLILSTDRLWILGHPFLELVYLYNEVDNLILFFPNSQYTVKPRNIGSAVIQGFECAASWRLPGSLAVSGNYSYLNGTDTSPIPHYNGNELAARPAHEASCMVELDRKRWSLTYDLHYIGSNYLDRANKKEVPARDIHNLALRIKFHEIGILLLIEGRNLGNNQISDVSGYPLPGRSFYTTIKFIL